MKKILLLGSGELGKELTIAFQRMGQHVVAVDSYPGAPAMQVAHDSEVIDMLDGNALDEVVAKHNPDFVVPEIEAIRTERFFDYEQRGVTVVPSAKAANYTMNRKLIRDLAAQDLGVKTAAYTYATSEEELLQGAQQVGFPCVVKPLMSSSGKGQSVMRSADDVAKSWSYANEGSRGDIVEVIVEAFVDFDYEITLLTVTQSKGDTLFCPPIGHRQERGDYQESWQPMEMSPRALEKAQEIAAAVTAELGGNGIWGVEFFVKGDEVYFSELSPRPHDTGMVTMAGTQKLNEFELHARAILGWPLMPEIGTGQKGVSAVILSHNPESPVADYQGVTTVLEQNPLADIRIFGKRTQRPYRRMGVVLLPGKSTDSTTELVETAKQLAQLVEVK